MNSFDVKDLSSVTEGLQTGAYGVIIDGIDEGRSIANEKGFEAFLDDIARFTKPSSSTSVVMLGRTQVVEDCWCYFTDKGVKTGLITIAPFNLVDARKYIDAFMGPVDADYIVQYKEARDRILEMLGKAFGNGQAQPQDDFFAFIGYPPVLDAIVTLLKEKGNYYKLLQDIGSADDDSVEFRLLRRITGYILTREKNQKVLPLFLDKLIASLPNEQQQAIRSNTFNEYEQCLRLVAHCLDTKIDFQAINEPVINERYEEHLSSFLPEHPFVDKREFRNAVFESVALAVLISSDESQAHQLVLDYTRSRKHSYHLIYLLQDMVGSGVIPATAIPVILNCAQEFRSNNSLVVLRVTGTDYEDFTVTPTTEEFVETQVEILTGENYERSRLFEFRSELSGVSFIELGHRLSSLFVAVSCDVRLTGTQEIELIAPVEISAKEITLQAQTLILKANHGDVTSSVILETSNVKSSLGTVTTNGIELLLAVTSEAERRYPLAKFMQLRAQVPSDPQLKDKYLRIKRILMEFRSHSKGSLAKYRFKIEHERVLRNGTGRAILNRLRDDGVLSLTGNFYHLHPEKVNEHLGISWQDFRRGRPSEALLNYLRSIVTS